jgi:hypothetical protein
MLKKKLDNNPRKPRAHDSPKRSQLPLSQGMVKKGNVFVDADDDDKEVRTSASQNWATAKLCTAEFFLRTPYI